MSSAPTWSHAWTIGHPSVALPMTLTTTPFSGRRIVPQRARVATVASAGGAKREGWRTYRRP